MSARTRAYYNGEGPRTKSRNAPAAIPNSSASMHATEYKGTRQGQINGKKQMNHKIRINDDDGKWIK